MAGTASSPQILLRRLQVAAVLLLFSGLAPYAMAAGKRTPPNAAPHRLLVGYFPQWGLYDDPPYTVKDLVTSGAATLLDQIDYAQGFVADGHCSVADSDADVNHAFTADTSVDGSADPPGASLRGNFHQLLELKRLYPKLKILISLEGHASDFAADAQPEARAGFVASCVDLFLKGTFAEGEQTSRLFDGIDLDWEYPRGADAANYIPLLKEFRRQMDALRPGLRLTAALGPSPRMYGDADVAAIGSLVDLAGLMTYDFDGPWSDITGLIAPLSSASPGDGSVEGSVAAWRAAGMPAAKLLVGLPFYGYGWRRVAGENHGLGQDGSPIRGDRPYRAIADMIPPDDPPRAPAAQTGARIVASQENSPPAAADAVAPPAAVVVYRDPVSRASWLFDGNSFWTYDDPASIRAKAVYADSESLGGFMVWELSEDTPTATLLNAAHAALAFEVGKRSLDAGAAASRGPNADPPPRIH